MIHGTVNTLAYGGKGILRTPDQFVLFVPFTAPGDNIECRIVKRKKNYGEAELVRIIEPSCERTLPACSHFGVCGGCQLQHLTYEAQLKAKQKVVQEALKCPNVPIFAADPIYNYRTHVTLTLKASQGGYKVGYFATDHTSLVEVKECPIFCKKNDPIMEIVKNFCHKLSPESDHEAKLKILKSNDQYILSFHFKKLPRNFATIAHEYHSAPIIGILGNSIHKNIPLGKVDIQFKIDQYRFFTEPAAFLQAHPQQSQEIYRAIANYFKNISIPFLIDLYCGIGISSILVSPFVKSIASIELNQKAIQFAKKNAYENGALNIEFQANRVEMALDSLLKQHPKGAILNPPREGLAREVAEKIAISSIEHLLYISCQPMTLARDLAILKEGGFHLSQAQAFDMFPQTGHVETLAILARA